MHIIETRDLCHTYQVTISALEGINFIAPRNCCIAVIGPNGAGKSSVQEGYLVSRPLLRFYYRNSRDLLDQVSVKIDVFF